MVHHTPWSISSRSVKRFCALAGLWGDVKQCPLSLAGHSASAGCHVNIRANHLVTFFSHSSQNLVHRKAIQYGIWRSKANPYSPYWTNMASPYIQTQGLNNDALCTPGLRRWLVIWHFWWELQAVGSPSFPPACKAPVQQCWIFSCSLQGLPWYIYLTKDCFLVQEMVLEVGSLFIKWTNSEPRGMSEPVFCLYEIQWGRRQDPQLKKVVGSLLALQATAQQRCRRKAELGSDSPQVSKETGSFLLWSRKDQHFHQWISPSAMTEYGAKHFLLP